MHDLTMSAAVNNTSPGNLALIRLRRFLYLGTENNCCQPSQCCFSPENIHCVQVLIDEGDISKVIEEIMDFHKQGDSLQPEALLYALAVCFHSKSWRTYPVAYDLLKEVSSSADSMLTFMSFLEVLAKPTSGWGRARRNFAIRWYNEKDPKELAKEVTRIKSIHRWSHRDVLRLAHVKPTKIGTAAVLKCIMKNLEASLKEFGNDLDAQDVLDYLKSIDELKHTTNDHIAARLVETHNLCYEHIPTILLKSKEVWACLIPRLPLNVVLQQLPHLSKLGCLKHNSLHVKLLLERLQNEKDLEESKLGPIETFVATRFCEISRKTLRKCVLQPRDVHLDIALINLHIASFKTLPSTGKRYLVAVDVHSSMVHGKTVGCCSLPPAEVSALVLMSLAMAEVSNVSALGFSRPEMVVIDINNKMKLPDITRRMKEVPVGPVNLAAPMQWAAEKKKSFDIIIILTDNRTIPGDVHPANALKEYRASMNIPNARLIICALSSRGFSLAPPDEPGMLDIAGFNIKILKVIQDFALGVF